MSKPRYWWWASVRAAIRQYPALARKKADLQAMPMTKAVKSIKGADGKLADLYATPGKGSGNGRTVERFALAELPPQEERIIEAVKGAIEATELGRDGKEHMAMLGKYYWDRKSLQAAADEAYIDYKTAQRWNATFARRVARGLGYLHEGTDK